MKIVLFLLFFLYVTIVTALKRSILFSYPVRFLSSLSDHGEIVGQDELVCFESKPASEQNILNSFLCLFPFYPASYCYDIWGSRSVLIRVIGEVEFIIPHSLPRELSGSGTISGTRLLELGDGNHEHIHAETHLPSFTHSQHSVHGGQTDKGFVQEILQLPSEHVTVCARSLLSERNSTFSVAFKSNFIREKDRRAFLEHFLYHVVMLLTISSLWLLPYLIAFIVFVLAFLHAMKKLLILLVGATAIVALTPFMLTKRNRQLGLLYISYFFRSSTLAEDSKLFLRQQRPLFQAFYFSAILLTFGSAASYLLYHYFGIDREYRNFLLRMTYAVSLSWCTFFVARSFDKFFRDWGWIILAIASINMIKDRINPRARNEIIVFCLLISLIIIIIARKSIHYAKDVLHFHPFKPSKKKITTHKLKKSGSSNINLDLKQH